MNAKPQMSAKGINFEFSDKISAITCAGAPLLYQMCERLGLSKIINEKVHVLKQHQPYHESDHVQSIAFNLLAGGTCIDHIEHRRRDTAYLDALGTHSLPDPTTAGDFCRRFESKENIDTLQDALNDVRLNVWKQQDKDFFERANIDGDGTLTSTNGKCKEGMDISYKGTWGYHPLVVSLANTGEPLFLLNRPGSRPSHEGAAEYFDKSKLLCKKGGFKSIHFRGDTDFSQTAHLDRWNDEGVTFTFGIDANKKVTDIANGLDSRRFRPFPVSTHHMRTGERRRPENVKEKIVISRGYKAIHTESESIAEVSYQPTKCKRPYRLVILKKVERISEGLLDNIESHNRYFFYISNRADMTAEEIVQDARDRCNQENLNANLKNGVHALEMPLGSLHANWAYAVMTSLAWSIKAWAALLVPVSGRWRSRHEEERRRLLRMEFHTFLQAMVNIPAQILKKGRRTLVRLLNWNEWVPVFFRLADRKFSPLRC